MDEELGNIEHNANSLTWALDNWMYTSEHNGYLRLKDGKFDYQQTLARGQWGATQDDAGRIYRNTNEAALFVDLLPARYFMRNPNLVRTRGSYESLQNDEVNTVWPVRPTPRRESRISGRHSAARWPVGAFHVGLFADRVPRRSTAARTVRATCSSQNRQRTWSAGSS